MKSPTAVITEDYNVNLFLKRVDEALRCREYRDFNDGLNSKVKLSLYMSFCKEIEFKNYLQGVGDPGTRLLFKFRSGTNGLNEELGRHRGKNDDRQLGRHRGKNDDRQCKLCGDECESVSAQLRTAPAAVVVVTTITLVELQFRT